MTPRQAEALTLREAGRTYEEVAEALGVSRTRARQLVRSAMSKVSRFEQVSRWTSESGDPLDRPIEMLPIAKRTRNALLRGGHRTLRSVLALSDDELLAIRYVGRVSLNEIRSATRGYDIGVPRSPV